MPLYEHIHKGSGWNFFHQFPGDCCFRRFLFAPRPSLSPNCSNGASGPDRTLPVELLTSDRGRVCTSSHSRQQNQKRVHPQAHHQSLCHYMTTCTKAMGGTYSASSRRNVVFYDFLFSLRSSPPHNSSMLLLTALGGRVGWCLFCQSTLNDWGKGVCCIYCFLFWQR